MKRITNRRSRRLKVAGILCAALAIYAGGYLLSCQVSQLDDCGPYRRVRRYHWRWEIPFYAPAAIVESAALGIQVWIGPRDTNHGGKLFPIGVEGRSAHTRLIPFPQDTKHEALPRQNIEIIDGQRVLKVPVVFFETGNTPRYSIRLEHELLEATELHDDSGVAVRWGYHFFVPHSDSGEIEVRRKADGTPAWHELRFPKARYLDLNGDGVFDALADYRQHCNDRLFIMFDGGFREVKKQGRGPSTDMRDARSYGGIHYRFDDHGTWQLADRSVRAYPTEHGAWGLPPREVFGPEWTRTQIPNTQMFQYSKDLNVPVEQSDGNVTRYSISLEREDLQIGEFNDSRGFFVSWHDDAHVDVRRHRDGSAAWYAVQFPRARYLDLNGDGVFDVFADFRQDSTNGQVFILLNDRFIAVQASVRDLSETMRSAKGTAGRYYSFEVDNWRMLPKAED